MTDWKARAEREAAAILDAPPIGGFHYEPISRDALITLMALAWLQGNIAGTHQTLADHERAFTKLRAAL